ncbi:MAG: PD40 domain-containing protein [Sphingobacteriaceae bacterium]|nr:PD40 domain-containing protein [Sphingobacteriaceae bacterium]
MKCTLRSVFSLFFFFLVVSAVAQITNTRKWRKTEKDSLDNALIVYDDKRYLLCLPIFEQLYKHHPEEKFLKYVYAKCAMYRPDKHEDSYTLLSDIYSHNHKVEDIKYDIAKTAHLTNRFDIANEFADKFLADKRTTAEGKKDALHLKKYIANAIYWTAKPTNAVIKNVGNVINTETDEYVPAITADETVMIFTHRGDKCKGDVQDDSEKPEDIYMSVKQDDQFTTPIGLDSINTDVHDAAISLSHDGHILFIYRDNGDDHGDIYQSFLIGDVFSKPYKLQGEVNTYSWDGHCSLSPDGQTLFFSSERSGGFGGKDIWKATLKSDSTWGNIQNLGDSINTIWDDDAPFIHPDGVTLYYSSKGKTSMGGYDIFQATMSQDSTFKDVENLGFPINSTDDDIYFVLSATGNNGYYSSGKHGGVGMKDIYLIETNFSSKRNLLLVKGRTLSDTTPVEAKVKIEVMTRDNRIFRSFNSNKANGQYLATLPKGAEYRFTYTYLDRAPDVFTISTMDIVGYSEKIHDAIWDKPDTAKPVITPTLTPNPSTLAPVPEDTWVAKTKLQEKTMRFNKDYGNISAEGLEFKVQIAAYKFPKNYSYKHLKKHGKVEKLLLNDGITRITIGGAFNTISKAWEHNKKVIKAGQPDAFVTALYKGKRVQLEELVKMGIFVK